MRLGDMLYEPGEQLLHAYYPTTAIVSLHYRVVTLNQPASRLRNLAC